jgi:hypothetical protein
MQNSDMCNDVVQQSASILLPAAVSLAVATLAAATAAPLADNQRASASVL